MDAHVNEPASPRDIHVLEFQPLAVLVELDGLFKDGQVGIQSQQKHHHRATKSIQSTAYVANGPTRPCTS